ncbi:MAG: PAS domain S-box protein, partial [Candidatus Korobacteraceae bacterium]
QTCLSVLATSPSLASGDLHAFYRQAWAVLEAHPGARIFLADATGQELINTFLPFGAPLPKHSVPDAVRQVFETGNPVTTKVFKGVFDGRFVISVHVPVFSNGRVVYDLAMITPADRLTTVLLQQQLSPEWVGDIFDSDQVIVARTRLTERFVGRQARPALRQRMRDIAEGTAEIINFENVPMFDSFSRSATSGWTVMIGVPKAIMMAGIRRWLWWTIAGTALLSLAGILLALLMARRIAGSIQDLIAPALALGRGESVAFGHLELAETNEVGESLVRASQLIQQRAMERERAEAARRETEDLKVFNAELERSEAAARALATELAAILDAVPAVTFIAHDPECRRITSNRAGYDLLRLPPGANTSKSAPESEHLSHYRFQRDGRALSPDELPVQLAATTGREVRDCEYTIAFGDGTTRSIFGNAVPLLDESGGVRGAVGAFIDITERKRAEEQLQATAERLQTILDNAPMGIAVNDREGRLIEPNAAYQRICGYSAEELKGKKFTDYTHPDDVAKNLELYEQLGSHKLRSYEMEKRYIRKDGKIIWIRVIAAKLNDENNIGIIEEITARKQAEQQLQATADRLKAILERAPVGIVITDREGRLIEYNAAHLRMCGRSAEELNGTSFVDYTHPDDLAKNLRLFELVTSGKRQSVEIEKRYLRKDGETIWVRVISSSLNKDFNIGIVEDITARKQAEQQLRATADRLKAILEHAPVGIVTGNRLNRFVETNAAFQRMIGYSGDELRGMGWKALTHPDDMARNTDLVDRLMRGTTKNYDFEKRYVLKDGKIIWVRVIGSRLDDEHKISIIEDITERKQAAEQLRRSEARLRRLIDSNIVGVVISGLDGIILDTNKAFLEMVGYARKDFKNGLGWRDLTPSEYRALDDAAVIQADETGVFRPYEKELFRKNGTRVPVIVGGAVTEDKEAIVFALDLTELKKARLELEQLARIVESADDAILSLSLAGIILSWNQGAERLLGYTKSEVIGVAEEILLPADNVQEWEQVREVMAGGKALDYFKTVRIAKSGEEKPVWLRISPIRDGSGRIIGISKIARDRSQAIQAQALEEQLRQAQKLESLGRLAGGVAHDFNNLLMVIQSYTEMLQDSLADDNPLRRNTQEVMKAASRAASLTRQMLAFSRKQILSPVVLDLNAVINETAKMLKRLIGEDIECRVRSAESLWTVEADSDQIVQILMNLCVNSRDAMPQGGTLTITTGNVTVEEGSIGGQPYVSPGDYVRLSVADTGTGISRDVQGHIFDPFFTTKEVGKGTGLGLATVYGIVKQSGGYVWVDSELGQGACFTIYLPRIKRATAADMLAKAEVRPRGKETLLVAEDEGALREATCDYLRSLGYTVFAASSGEEALSLAGQFEGRINLLITDLVMPGISGRELAQTLESLRPDLKTVYMSGYSADAVLRSGIHQGAAFLQKPFSLGTLARKVRDALGRTGTTQ